MKAENVVLNPNQLDVLRNLVNGKAAIGKGTGLDLRTVRALETRGFAKVTENKKGIFAAATAKGKKILN